MQAVILDRDGVINHDSPDYVKSPEEWNAIDGSLEAIARLTKAGIKVFIASNQSGLAYGLFDYNTLYAMHKKLLQQTESLGGRISGFFFCPFLTGPCRKPNPGLLVDIANRAHIDLETTPFIGDAMRDLEAAIAVDAIPILVRTGKGTSTFNSGEVPDHVQVHANLYEAVDSLLKQRVTG
ncbi:MAG: D-glycero-beta-D-manno-heptose 1,7-bisphosphate 7-phosphatase [Gammaproteobacteria bacterium]